ncbi:MAG: hypothetical protein ACPL06_04190 [Candidatus Anstonellales archaeon]
MNEEGVSHEGILRVVRIVEDVAKIHALYEEIDRLEIPDKLRIELNKMIETMEMLSLLRVANITGHIPMDYESEYTKIKRGVAYVKMDEEWVRLGITTKYETIEELVKHRATIAFILISTFEEVLEESQIDVGTLAVLLRNMSERLLLNEQEQGEGLSEIYDRIREKIEKCYSEHQEGFTDEVDIELKKANENYIYFQISKRNRMFEDMIKNNMLCRWEDVYAYMPFYYTDEHGVLEKLMEKDSLLDLDESSAVGEDSAVDEGLLKEVFAAISSIFGTENENDDSSLDGSKGASITKEEAKEDVRKDVRKKLEENKIRMRGLLYGYFQKREEQKAEEQLDMIKSIEQKETLEKLKGAVEDMVVMRRLSKQIERTGLSDETKRRYASIAQSLELLHMIKSGIINQGHKRDFWEIRNGVVYLKNPGIKFWDVGEQEIKLGSVIEERGLVIEKISLHRKQAFAGMRKSLEKDVEGMNCEELAELLENIGRRLVFNQQDQHYGILVLEEGVWRKLKEKYEEERASKNGTDEFALKSDRIATKIITTIKYIEEMKTDDENAKMIGRKLKEEMYPVYLESKMENIVRFRKESEKYMAIVEEISEGVSGLVETIEYKDPTFKGLWKEQVSRLFETENIDYDKVLLKGARDKAFPLIGTMRKIITMIESGKYDEKVGDLEILFEASAVLVSKFVLRFQIPYVLKEEKGGPAVMPLNYGESIFMIQGLTSFLDVLYKWRKLRVAYYEYEIETKRAIDRVTEEALCPAIDSIEKAYKAVEIIGMMVGADEKMKKEVAETIGFIADRAMVIDIEAKNAGKKLEKDDKLMMNIILYTASAYTENYEYREYADKEFGDPITGITEALKNKKDPYSIDFGLDFIKTEVELKSSEKGRPSELKKYYFSKLLEKLDELKQDVEKEWDEGQKQKLAEIIRDVRLVINGTDASEVKKGGVSLGGKGSTGTGLDEKGGMKRKV